jgi:uncharacterized membrane protein
MNTPSNFITDVRSYILENPGKSTIFICSIILAVAAIGAILLPELVWDQFIWRYYWGPIAADAEDRSIGAVTEGYNIISTITYGIILAAAILVIYRLILIFEIKMDKWFFLAIIPYVLFGGFLRALEDAKLFKSPLVFLFIAPVIYIVIGLAAIALMIASDKLVKYLRLTSPSKKKGGVLNQKPFIKFTSGLALCFIIINIIFLILFFQSDWMNYKVVPILPIVLSFVFLFAILAYFKKNPSREIPAALLFGLFGTVLLSYSLSAVAGWYTSPAEWIDVYLASDPVEVLEFRPIVIPLILGLALIATLLWAGVVYFVSTRTKWQELAIFGSGINLAIVFGQFTDASATYIAIDFFSYGEKHVVPGFLIGVLDTAAVMFILKIFALLFAIYLLDIGLRSDLTKHPKIIPLIKIAILVLGLAPGTRDMLRLAMGV